MARRLAALALVTLTACSAPAPTPPAPASTAARPVNLQDFAQLERTFDARLGIYAIDTGTGRDVAYHADDRFGYASTHKVLSSGTVLEHTPIDGLGKRITFRASDVVANSPVTSKHVADGMTLREIMDAALRYSDNTAANMLFREIGGPPALTASMRALGDTTIHADRLEPDLNLTGPGEIRDTTTPRAMAADLRAFTLGQALPADRRDVLVNIMRANTTGTALIRAGVPSGWQVADKTGSADHATRNDIGVVWPPRGAPIVLVIFSDRQAKDAKYDDKLIAQAAAAVVKQFR